LCRYAEDEGGLEIHLADMRPRWVAVVSQLDVIDLMVRDADSLGAFPHVNTMVGGVCVVFFLQATNTTNDEASYR
jgi:hypothetical protein